MKRAQKGFTLAELLAALAVGAILLLPLAELLHVGTEAARNARTAPELDAEARFAFARIAARAAAATNAASAGAPADPAAWLAPLTYTVANQTLIETDTSAKPVRTSVIAANVTAFRMSVPEVVTGAQLLAIDLTLKNGDIEISRTRTVRAGSTP